MRTLETAAAAGLVALLGACELQSIPGVFVGDARHRVTANERVAADALLAAHLVTALKSDPVIQNAEIQVSVSNGHVRLIGFVDSAAARLRAGALAQATGGIEGVENRLILRHRADTGPDPIGDARVYL